MRIVTQKEEHIGKTLKSLSVRGGAYVSPKFAALRMFSNRTPLALWLDENGLPSTDIIISAKNNLLLQQYAEDILAGKTEFTPEALQSLMYSYDEPTGLIHAQKIGCHESAWFIPVDCTSLLELASSYTASTEVKPVQSPVRPARTAYDRLVDLFDYNAAVTEYPIELLDLRAEYLIKLSDKGGASCPSCVKSALLAEYLEQAIEICKNNNIEFNT